MNGAVAKYPTSFYPCLTPPAFKRTRTVDCETTALDVLEAYRDFGKVKKDEYNQLVEQIKAAPHDDAISNIMTRLRKRVYG